MPSTLDDKIGSFSDLAKESSYELWLIFALKGLWSLAEFSLISVLVLFLSDDLKMSDTDAGWVFGLIGLVKAVYSLICGFAVDILGVKTSLVLGSFMMTLGLVVVASTQSSQYAIFALLTVKSFGSALLLNPMMFAVRRYTTARTRPYAFSLFYVVMNASAFMAQLLVNAIRNSRSDGLVPMFHWMSPGSAEMSLWRLVIWFSVVSGALTVILTMFVREMPMEEEVETSSGTGSPQESKLQKMLVKTMKEPKFWRLVALCTVFVGVRLIFVHLNATFPKFFTREVGSNAPFELIVAINPGFIIFLVPVFTSWTQHFHCGTYFVLLLGSILTALSPLPLVYDENSYAAAISFVILLSAGEALWSPKLYEYTVAVSPPGREGTYGALATTPIFLSTFFAGGFSGHLLQVYCPHSKHCDGFTIWLMVFLCTLTSPLILLFCRSCLFHDDDTVKEEALTTSPSYGAADDSNRESVHA
jgi:MFS family permease